MRNERRTDAFLNRPYQALQFKMDKKWKMNERRKREAGLGFDFEPSLNLIVLQSFWTKWSQDLFATKGNFWMSFFTLFWKNRSHIYLLFWWYATMWCFVRAGHIFWYSTTWYWIIIGYTLSIIACKTKAIRGGCISLPSRRRHSIPWCLSSVLW